MIRLRHMLLWVGLNHGVVHGGRRAGEEAGRRGRDDGLRAAAPRVRTMLFWLAGESFGGRLGEGFGGRVGGRAVGGLVGMLVGGLVGGRSSNVLPT